MSYTLGSNVENLALSSKADLKGTGNTAANMLTGNSGDNKLYGLSGNDTLNGGSGKDILVEGLGTDKLTGHSGELRYEKDGSDTWIYGDTDSNKKIDFTVHLDDAMTLKADYFML